MKVNARNTSHSVMNMHFLYMILINILTNVGFSVFATTITPYSVSLGFSLTSAGFITSIFSVTALLIRPFAGTVFDRFSKRNVFFLSTFFFGAVIFGYAFVSQMWSLVLLRICHGILFGVNTTVMMALASTFLPRDRIGEGMGYFSASMLLGQAIGPTLGAFFLERMGYFGMYSLIALMICLPALFIWCLPIENDKPDGQGAAGKAPVRISEMIEWKFLLHALVCAGFSLFGGMANAFVRLIGEERGIGSISVFFTVSSLMLMVVRLLIGKYSDKAKLRTLVDAATIFTCVSALLVAHSYSLTLFIVAAVARAVGQGIGHVSVQSEALKQADIAKVGIVSGTLLIGNDIGNILAPMLGGVIAERAGYAAAFYACLIIVLVLGCCFHIAQNRREKGTLL